jgi:hypothetical protein
MINRKKIYGAVLFLIMLATSAHAGVTLKLGYDVNFIFPNERLNGELAHPGVVNGHIGYEFPFNLEVALRYDHMVMDDYIYSGENARVVAILLTLPVGYTFKLFHERFHIGLYIAPGYAISVRYRLGVTDYKSHAFALAGGVNLHYRLIGRFLIGIDTGYRYLEVPFTSPAQFSLNLSGPYVGLSMKHLF